MKCIICGTNSWRYLFPARDRMFGIAGEFSEYRCGNCGLVRLHPVPNNIKRYYPSARYYSYASNHKQSFFEALRSYLIKHRMFTFVPAMPSGKPGRILDIGCGSGGTLSLLQALGWDVYGLDIDKQAIQSAITRGVRNANYGTYKKLNKFPDRYFDVIRMYHVIEHIEDPAACLSFIYRKLKKGGELIIGTPNVESTIAHLAKQYWYNLDCPRHLFLFSPDTLDKLVTKAGFRSDRITFRSAGGWLGSLQYKLEEAMKKDIDLINLAYLVMLLYPLEWALDRIGLGDVFVLYARK